MTDPKPLSPAELAVLRAKQAKIAYALGPSDATLRLLATLDARVAELEGALRDLLPHLERCSDCDEPATHEQCGQTGLPYFFCDEHRPKDAHERRDAAAIREAERVLGVKP